MRTKDLSRPFDVFVNVLVLILGLACLFPFLWMLRSSLMSNIEINTYPPLLWPSQPRWENYPAVLQAFPFGRYLVNTLIIALPSLIGVLLTSTLAAYALARIDFPGRKVLFALVIGSMLIPGAVTIIPIFLGWTALGLSSGYIPLIVPAFLGGGAFNIFLVRQFLMTIPRDLDEAALIDGASHRQILFDILLPLVTPVLISVGLFTFILYWNDLLGPLIYINDTELNTISQALANFKSGFGTDWKAIMAASVMAIVPPVVLYFFGQKYFVEGIVLSGLKS
jgi:multiple sugar transport system permease protein